jgi:hypothetical protein
MPRINLGSNVSRAHTDAWQPPLVQAWYVDICKHCWYDTRRENPRLKRSIVHHIPYQEQQPRLHCWLCQAPLDADDNVLSR